MKPNIGENIKKLRNEKQITQEQLAAHLSISCQAISKWENNVSTPDIFLLPTIAEYFEVTVDELFKHNMKAYKNKAQRLLSVYERTKKKEDYERANAEYEKLIASGEHDGNDLRFYGILHEYHVYILIDKAQELYVKAVESGDEGAESQLLRFMSHIGRNEQSIQKYTERLKNDTENKLNWWLVTAAYEEAKIFDKALETCLEGLEKFTNDPNLMNLCGHIYSSLKKYDEAFSYWKNSISYNPDIFDNYYSMAQVYDKIGDYTKALEMWEKIDSMLEKRGYSEEREWPGKEIEKLKKLVT